MVDGLTRAFASIANAIKAYTTSFSLSTVQVSSTGAASYASQYDSNGWSGVLTASNITFASDGTPSSTAVWSSATTLRSPVGRHRMGHRTPHRHLGRRDEAGVPFRQGSLPAGPRQQ